ncbi:hypothetical protein [Geothrix paludis]|uniref:hypothetical protein n=1 Tax=Geothrix paludis TaxID=2922722 RepID=UPI001FAE1A20|nr:hypothetical protein [Geothrix paludis]
MPTAPRPKITGITLDVLMPDGTTQAHVIDPTTSDALVWSDRAVQVFRKFYDKGGPAEGKRMTREDFLQHFPQAVSLIGDQPDILINPAVVDQLWTLPKPDGTTPAFLCKSTMNPTNG